MKNKILLVNDTYDDNNLGCKATTEALYRLIDNYLDDCNVTDVIKLYHTERSELNGVIPEADIDDYELKSTHNYLMATLPLQFELNKIVNCDIVVINGEGSIYKTVLKCRYILYVAYIAKKVFSKKVYLINHTADISMIRDIAKRVYPILDGVAVREPVSYRELLNAGIHNIVQASDAIFCFESSEFTGFHERLPFGFDIEKDYIMLGGSSLNHALYEKWNGVWDVSSFYNLITSLRDNTHAQIMLVDVGGDSFLREFDRLENVYYGKMNYNDYVLLAKQAKIHISGRHHGLCLAAIAGCPLIGLSANTHKIKGDFELLNWNLPVIDFYKINESTDQILNLIKELLENNIIYRQAILEKIEETRERARQNVLVVKEKL